MTPDQLYLFFALPVPHFQLDFCLTACSLGWTALELGGDDPRKATSSPEPLFFPRLYPMGFFQTVLGLLSRCPGPKFSLSSGRWRANEAFVSSSDSRYPDKALKKATSAHALGPMGTELLVAISELSTPFPGHWLVALAR